MKTRNYTKYGIHLIVELEKCIKYAEVKMVCMKIWQKALLEKYCLRDFIMGEKDWHDCFTSATRISRCNIFKCIVHLHTFYSTTIHLNEEIEVNIKMIEFYFLNI